MNPLIDKIRNLILSGELPQGEFIRQDTLAQLLGVSKIPVREALIMLAVEGYAEYVPRRGIRVKETTPEELIEIYQLLKSLELIAFKKSWPYHSPSTFDRAEYLLHQIDHSTPKERELLNWKFHYFLIKDCNMNHLLKMLEILYSRRIQIFNHSMKEPVFPDRKNHREVLAACRKRRYKIAKALLLEQLELPPHYEDRLKENKKNLVVNPVLLNQRIKSKVRKKMEPKNQEQHQWKFWIDRGGTFTDLISMNEEGKLNTLKILSHNPQQYEDATIEGIRRMMNLKKGESIDSSQIAYVKMGTTVATNALLERKGEKTALMITEGLKDALQIGYQNRPRLFDLDISMPEVLYSQVIEVQERIDLKGKILVPLNNQQVTKDLKHLHQQGYRSLAIVLMHAYRYPEHEKKILDMAYKIGFEQVSASYQMDSLIKIVGRGDTAVADAYLNPILQKYVNHLSDKLQETKLFFMQSNSGLTSASTFKGKDAILSGPAGGMVGMVKTAEMANISKVIGFDMGGTSTDVCHYDGEYERVFENVVSGVRLRAPMMNIFTVAAGGGSILKYDGMRFTVGPESAGADPGPACYRKEGPLTVTDCHVLLGHIDPDYFPKVFGKSFDQSIDLEVVTQKFNRLAQQTGKKIEEIANGFLRIAIENMVNAIKKISVQRGYDVSKYVLYCFGGAAAQHACQVAESLEIEKILIHPFSSVLSAYGMGLADMIEIKGKSIERPLNPQLMLSLEEKFKSLEQECTDHLDQQGIELKNLTRIRKVHLRYAGTNTEILTQYGELDQMILEFKHLHRKRFGFEMKGRELVLGTLSVEVRVSGETIDEPNLKKVEAGVIAPSLFSRQVYFTQKYHSTLFYDRKSLLPGHTVLGPAIIIEENSTVLVEPGWQANISEKNHLLMIQVKKKPTSEILSSQTPDPVRLEIFNNLFMSIAEQMGEVLANTAYSVNIKERLDFSCAIFDRKANLIANAPHMPVHLGSMGESVKAVIGKWNKEMNPGDTFILNDPYGGGTHLPDITLVTPVYLNEQVTFYVASRGHHADIGGSTPGSMASNSSHLDEEGVLIPNLKIVEKWEFKEDQIRNYLLHAPYPARNVSQNLEDLKAQLASNEKGVVELMKTIHSFGKETVLNYIVHVQNNAEESVRRIIAKLKSNRFELKMDHGSVIKVMITIDPKNRQAKVDFTGTSAQSTSNFNAPIAICRAAVLYVFRTLVKENIPMNEGCLKAINLVVPSGCLLNPSYPAAVVAGNVETSQAIVDTLYGALKTVAEAQGTMNNLTFGNSKHQYYETICGGTGAGKNFHGADGVHSHMTNSLMTDHEILELRYPVIVRRFKIRKGSGGKGRFNGGNGVIREIEFNEPMTLSILSGHRIYPPYGLNGGQPGQLGINQIITREGKKINLKGCDQYQVSRGDRIRIETPGGGGYGTPSNPPD